MSNILYMPKKTWQTELGTQIKLARENRGLSQSELAKLVHTKRGSIYLYEKGKGNPQFKTIAEIAAALEAVFDVLGCRIAAAELLEPSKLESQEQLKLAFDQDHSFLANVTIRPSKKSITITTQADFGIKSA